MERPEGDAGPTRPVFHAPGAAPGPEPGPEPGSAGGPGFGSSFGPAGGSEPGPAAGATPWPERGAYAPPPPPPSNEPPTQAYGPPSGPPPPPPLPGHAVQGPPPPAGPGWPAEGGPQPYGPGERRRSRNGTFVLVVIIVAVVAALGGGAIGGVIGARQAGSDGYQLQGAPKGSTQRPAASVAGVADRVRPSVVDIKVSSLSSGEEGSGFLVQGGYIMTNNHVVASAASGGGDLQVNFNDGSRTAAKIVGRDASYDIAVLKPDDIGGRKPLPLGNSDSTVVGDPVIAVGSPLGLAGTVTTGIISAKDRPVTAGGEDGTQQSYINALQTDAAINPGNSGGPLVDSSGAVIGVNSAIASNSGAQPGQQAGSIGLGFAIPINKARQVAEQLIKTGKVKHPVIGALIDMSYSGDGARIAQDSRQGPGIVKGGPAEKAGLKAGDVITKIDGKPINTAEELLVDIKSHQPGQTIQVTYRRGGSEQTVKVKLGAN